MTQPHYEAPGDLQVEIVENAVINIGLVRLSLKNCPKLTVEQPNSSWKKDFCTIFHNSNSLISMLAFPIFL